MKVWLGPGHAHTHEVCGALERGAEQATLPWSMERWVGRRGGGSLIQGVMNAGERERSLMYTPKRHA